MLFRSQVLVYAGAVMVLFLFVIMHLDLKEEEQRKIKATGAVLAIVTAAGIYALFVRAFGTLGGNPQGGSPQVEGGVAPLGRMLFTDYLLPLEMISVLLLVAMIGVILLSKKEEK